MFELFGCDLARGFQCCVTSSYARLCFFLIQVLQFLSRGQILTTTNKPTVDRTPLGADGLKQLHVFSTLLRIISVNLRRSGVVPQSRALLCCGYSSHAIFALPFHSSTGLGIALESELHYLLMGVLREKVIMPLFASGTNVYSDTFVISLCPQLFLPHQQIHTNITIAEQTIHGVKLTQSSLHYCTDFFLAVC